MHEGAVFVEVILDPDRVIGQVPLLLSPKRTVYPTGLWCVVPEELARLMSVEVEWGFAFVEPAAWDTLGLPRPEIATC